MRSTTRALLAGACLLLFGACTPQQTANAPPPPTICTGQRQQACTRDYRPVCGTDVRNASQTYANACEACANKQVVSHRLGAC